MTTTSGKLACRHEEAYLHNTFGRIESCMQVYQHGKVYCPVEAFNEENFLISPDRTGYSTEVLNAAYIWDVT